MKKTDAIRWEKLEGEGQESNIKHFNPSQSTASAFTLLPPSLLLSLSLSHHSVSPSCSASSYFSPALCKDQYKLLCLSVLH